MVTMDINVAHSIQLQVWPVVDCHGKYLRLQINKGGFGKVHSFSHLHFIITTLIACFIFKGLMIKIRGVQDYFKSHNNFSILNVEPIWMKPCIVKTLGLTRQVDSYN